MMAGLFQPLIFITTMTGIARAENWSAMPTNDDYSAGIRDQEKEALFVSVIGKTKGIIYKIARAYCPDMDERKDLVQEIMIQVWKSFDRYEGRASYSTWIYRIALNVSISYYRKEKRRKISNNPLSGGSLDIIDQIPGDEKDEKDANVELLFRFISELKELDKALMILYLDEKSHKEMAEVIGISETNVATKISRIKEKLKQKFSQIKN
jgi:RNA polymerase sigma factor (sigma-70 family)